MIFSSFEKNPIPQILALPTPKKQKTGIKCIDVLITSTSFHQFSRDELNSFFSLLSNGQTLEILKNEYDIKSEIFIPSLSPLINENVEINDPNIKNIVSFYILRCSITFMSQNTSAVTSSSLKKMFQLLVYSIDNNNSNLTNLSKQIFLIILSTFIEKINPDMLEILKHFFNIVNGYNDESLIVLISMIKRLLNQSNPTVDSFLLDYTSQFILKANNFNDVKNSLKNSIFPLLNNFDTKSISFISKIISKLDFKELENFFKDVPQNLLNFQTKPFLAPPNLINSNIEIFTCDIEKVHTSQLFPFIKIDSFDSSYKIDFTIPRFMVNNYFPNDLTKLLLNLRNIVEKMPEANKLLSQLFIDLIKEEDKKTTEKVSESKLFDIVIMSLFVCTDDYLNLIILQSKIFSPNISTYEYKQLNDTENEKRNEYELIFNARTICLQQMRNLFSIIFPFLFSFYQYPLFVGDIFSFLIDDHIPNLVDMNRQNRDLLLEQIYRISGDYQFIQIRNLSSSQDKISYSRIEILFYILKLLKKEENSQLLIKNALFMQMIVSFMCEEKLRPIVLQTIEEVCTKSEFDLSDCFSDFIKFIIMYNDDNKIRYDTLTSLNKIVSSMPDYKEYFNELVNPLIDSLNSISKNSDSDKNSFSLIYMKSIFKFVSLASIDSSISSTKKILTAIQQIEGDDPSDETFNTLLNTISGTNKKYKFNYNEETKKFEYEEIIIKYPSILGAFLKAFQKSSKFIGILQMLKESCSRSRENAIKCHEGQVDLLLIDIIKEFIEKDKEKQTNSKEKDENIIINAFQLFSSIALISSNVEVVQNFFSLFNEVDHQKISIHQSIFYIILNDLTSMKESFDEYLPLSNNSPVVQIHGINNINVNSGFSIHLWIYLSDMKNSNPKFFSIVDDKRNKIEMFGENKMMKVKISKNDEVINLINLDIDDFDINDWNQIIISFTNIENKFLIVTSIKTTIKSASKIYPFEQLFELDKNNLNIIFGGSNSLVQNIGADSSAIKSIGIYQLLEENEAIELFKGKSPQTVNKTIATIDFLNKDNYLVLDTNFPLQKINAKLVGPSIFISNSFKNVLINNDMLFMIFPLFNQSNCVLTDGRKTPDFCRILYMILFNVLQSSLKAQILFYKSNGVEILTHILCNDENISFANYQSLFQLFKKIKLMKLKMEIMGKILLNMNIWIHSDALSQLQIYRDWSRTLNTKLNDYTNRFINFGTLLRDLRTFYWFTPIEKNIIYSKRNKDLNLKIVDIRSSILQILHSIAQKPELFGYNELSLLISHITSCKDIKQVLSLLSFIRLIIVSPETPLRNIDNLWPQIARLHSLLLSSHSMKRKPPILAHISNNNNNSSSSVDENDKDDNSSIESVCLAVIDIFVTLHFLKIIEYPEVNIHVSIIIDILPINNITHQFFVKFFPFAMKYPEVTPLLFFLGMKMGENELKIIVNKVNPDVKFSSTKYWDLYAILFGLKYGGENLDFISKFLAYSMHNKWDQAYQTITLIGFIFDIDTDEFKSKFLTLVCKNIMETASLFNFECLHNFFDVALLHIFFRKANEVNSGLNALFMNSPFASECIEKVEKPKSSLEVSKQYFFDKLIKDSEKIQNQSCFQSIFGLRFDKEGHWLDCELAIKLVQLSLKTKVQTFHNSSSILLAFLLHENPEDQSIKNYIEQLISKRAVDKPFLDFLNYVYKNETFSKKNHFECFEIFIHDRLNINNSILNGISNLAKNLEQLHLDMKEETIEINKICINKKENEQESDEMQNHLIQNHSTIKTYTKEYQSNEDLVKTVMKDNIKEINNNDEIRKNFFNEIDCLVKYKKIKTKNKLNENHTLNLILNPIENSYLMHQRGGHGMKKDKSVMVLSTPNKIKYSSSFYDDSTTLGKINENNNDTHSNLIEVNALYYPQNNPVHSIKVKFTVSGSKIVISNKKLIHSSILESNLVFKELDADEIKKMIFMPLRSMPIGIEIITNHPKKVYYITLLSNDSLSTLKKIASFKEFKNVLIQTQQPNFFFKSMKITNKWREGRMSNFEYLMKLNRYSGRTFCNADSYPIFPRLEENLTSNNDNNTKLRDLKEPLNPNSPISDAFGVISLLKQRLPFKKEFTNDNNNNGSFTPLRSPRKSPRNAITFASNNANSSSGNLSVSNDSIINSNNSLNLDSCLIELTPEFFYDLKFFKVSEGETKKDEDENRASFEKIYNRRKLLESLDIADFVDLVWGIRRKAYNDDFHNFLPYQLFKHHHPKRNQRNKENSGKKSIISFRDEFHSPVYVANEMCSIVDVPNDENKTKNYVYSFICIDKKSSTIYRVDIDIERKSILSKETWSKLQGNVFASMKMNPNQNKSSNFSLRSIFSSQLTSQNHEKSTKEEDLQMDIESQTIGSSSRVLRDDDSQVEGPSTPRFETTSTSDASLLTFVSAFSFSQSSLITNINDRLKKFTYRTNQTSLIDSEIVNGIELLACDNEIVAAAGKTGSVITIYRDFEFVKVVPTFRDKITALHTSSSFGLVAATTADGFLVLIDASCSNKSKITTQKSVDLHSINEKHRNSSRHEIQDTDQISPENNINDQITSEKDIIDVGSKLDFSSLHVYSPKLVLITKKWGFVVVYSEIDLSVEKDDQNPHKVKRHRSKLSHGSFTTLSNFFSHDKNKKNDEDKSSEHNKRFYNDEDMAVGVIDVFSSNGDFIRREFVNSSIRCWTSFSTFQDFDYVAAADEDGKIFVFEVFYAMIDKPIANLRGKEIDFLFVEEPYTNIFAFSNNGDVDVIPIQK